MKYFDSETVWFSLAVLAEEGNSLASVLAGFRDCRLFQRQTTRDCLIGQTYRLRDEFHALLILVAEREAKQVIVQRGRAAYVYIYK